MSKIKQRIETLLNTHHIELGTNDDDFVKNRFTVKVTQNGRFVSGLSKEHFIFLKHKFIGEISPGVYKFEYRFTLKELIEKFKRFHWE